VCGRLSQVGQTDWFTFPVRGQSHFYSGKQALDETGAPTESKALPSIGVWDAFKPVGTTRWARARTERYATGETCCAWQQAATTWCASESPTCGGWPADYAYNGWVLYADTVSPTRLPASADRSRFRAWAFAWRHRNGGWTGGHRDQHFANQITAVAPPAAAGVTGSVDVEVDDQPVFYAAAVIPGGVSYDSGNGDTLTIYTAPQIRSYREPLPFSVTALGANLTPAAALP